MYDAVGWKDWDGNNWAVPGNLDNPNSWSDNERPLPGDASEVQGILVHAWNDDDPAVQRHFWAYTYAPWDDYEAWDDYIDGMIEMYGLEAV